MAELHIHGWSNHSASETPASIAWHTVLAASAGVDVMWWTDHSNVYVGRLPDFVVTPTSPKSLSPGTWTVGTWSSGDGTAFLRSSAGVLTSITESASRITVGLPPGGGDLADTIQLYFGRLDQNVPQRASLLALARPLIGDPLFSMTVWRDPSVRQFPGLLVTVPLAWHPGGADGHRDVLEYRYRSSVGPSVANSGDTISYERSWPDSDSTQVQLTPKADADVMPGGLDNTTDQYDVTFVVPREGRGATLSFAFPSVANRDSSAAVQMPPAIATAEALGQAYGMRVIWGIELGFADSALTNSPWAAVSGGGTHMAVYLPTDVSPAVLNSLRGSVPQVAQLVAAAGGLSSIPHPLGTSVALPTKTFQENRAHVDSLGAFLVAHHAWGENFIEAYPQRGEAGVREHAYLVDYLLSSGIHICPVGASDSHGQRLLPDPVAGDEKNNFVTWIADVSRTSPTADLVSSMRACQMSFGTPFYVRGGLWAQAVSDTLGRQYLNLDSQGVSPSALYYLFEVAIDSSGVGHEPEYVAQGLAIRSTSKILLGGCGPSIARVEAWAGTRFLASSNLVRVAADPTRCAAGVARH